jgi:hypothetical protein
LRTIRVRMFPDRIRAIPLWPRANARGTRSCHMLESNQKKLACPLTFSAGGEDHGYFAVGAEVAGPNPAARIAIVQWQSASCRCRLFPGQSFNFRAPAPSRLEKQEYVGTYKKHADRSECFCLWRFAADDHRRYECLLAGGDGEVVAPGSSGRRPC